MFGVNSVIRVAFSSDNHFDVNKVDVQATMAVQAEILLAHGVQFYLIAGDLFNDFQRSQQFVVDLQALLGTQTHVYWIAGNHDMVHGISFDELETGQFAGYLHNRYVDLPHSDWRLIGHNGWYDYGFAQQIPGATVADFEMWKHAYWIDRAIQQPMNDPERATLMLNQVDAQLALAKAEHKRVIFMTHFVPKIDYLRFTADNRFWNMANALMGTPRLGTLVEQYQVSHVLFGHLHIHPQPRQFAQTIYYDQAVGYGRPRLNEWQESTFMAEWQRDLEILDLAEK
ncbi:metallophosphoesterase [Lactiplantibacillus sp. WILCCON 0030]|uniref:Metallophosphoesterase n=1 Tax=Lactiplantibacillus brownii TaxID=3069269 RepID=A0ABU1A7Y8_9LACO|nr:metallophosphoesterase [Lactiplantibacillus brownii]MDQ7936455.1 metallophosphoesterase [Lactiplantibacillus brownii]